MLFDHDATVGRLSAHFADLRRRSTGQQRHRRSVSGRPNPSPGYRRPPGRVFPSRARYRRPKTLMCTNFGAPLPSLPRDPRAGRRRCPGTTTPRQPRCFNFQPPAGACWRTMPLAPARHNPGTIRPPGPSAKITQGARTLRQDPPCNASTANTQHDRGSPVPPDPARAAGNSGPGPGGGARPAAPPARTTRDRAGPGLPDRRAARAAAGSLPRDGAAAGDRRQRCRTRWCAAAPGRRPAGIPRRFADDFAASGLDTADLAAFAAQWRARVTAPAQ